MIGSNRADLFRGLIDEGTLRGKGLFSNGSSRPTYRVSNYSSIAATGARGNDSASVENAAYPVLLGGWLIG